MKEENEIENSDWRYKEIFEKDENGIDYVAFFKIKAHYYYKDGKTRGGKRRDFFMVFDTIDKTNKNHQKVFLKMKDLAVVSEEKFDQVEYFRSVCERGIAKDVLQAFYNEKETLKEITKDFSDDKERQAIEMASLNGDVDFLLDYPDSLTDVFMLFNTLSLREYGKK